MLRGLRFLELFRRRRSFEERLSALQSTFDDPQSGGTQQALSGQQHRDDARAELLIGLNDNLDEMRQEMRQGSRGRFGAIFLAAVGIFIVLNSTDLRGAVLGGILLVLAFGGGWFDRRKRLRRVRKLQAWIERELSSPMPKASLPQPSDGSSGETS
ncbi:MAG: hypothetical protein IID07_07910 [Gemmatimonadetes bacterium]|nr:hypothetical protein [Gemmatimonadota bacterium]